MPHAPCPMPHAQFPIPIPHCPFPIPNSPFPFPIPQVSFSMIPVISTIPVVQLASGDRLSLQVYQFQGAVPETKGYI